MARLQSISIYPVKAARGEDLSFAHLSDRGLVGDREWMLTRPDGTFLSQRTHPQLARLVATRREGGLSLAYGVQAPLTVNAFEGGSLRDLRVWDDRMQGWDAGDAAADWLATALGVPARLARVTPATRRMADRHYVGEQDVPVAFSDGYPILVCTMASLAELNRRLPAPVPMDRFRPNLVLDGLDAFEEDRIRAVRIGSVVLHLVKPCTRCSVPTIDQLTGTPSTDPIPALKAFRFDRELGGVTFGVNAYADAPPGAELSVGEAVEILA